MRRRQRPEKNYLLPTMDEWEIFPRQAVAVALKAIEQKVARVTLSKETAV